MSVASRQLTETHRLAQAQIGALTVLQMRTVWRLLDPENVDATFREWLTAAKPIVNQQRAVSARTASAFLITSKALQLGRGARVTPVFASDADDRALTTSLLVTGPLSIKRAMTRAVSLGLAADTALAASSATAMRYALDAGRETILSTVQSDRDARGWARVASGTACDFCQMLDGKVHSTDDADFPAHDGCSCGQEPLWR